MTLEFLPTQLQRPAVELPADAVCVFELCGQSNSYGTQSFETDQPAEVQERWKDVENYAQIWSRCKDVLRNDEFTLNLTEPPSGGADAIDQWRPITKGYGRSGIQPWLLSRPIAIGSERVIAHYIRDFWQRDVYCIKACSGGLSINDQGVSEDDYSSVSAVKDPGNFRMWGVWRNRYRPDALAALRTLIGVGPPIYHVGVVWLQGAADMNVEADKDNYPASLDGIVSGIRAEDPNVPIALGRSEDYFKEDGTFEGTPNPHIYCAEIRAAQEAKAAATSNCELFNTDPCDFYTDLEHWNGIGQWKMGTAAAYALRQIDGAVVINEP